MKKPSRLRTERNVSISLFKSGDSTSDICKSDSKYFRSMIQLCEEADVKLTRICDKHGLSKSVVIEYLLGQVKMTEFERAVKDNHVVARRVGRAKKSFHNT